MGLISKVTGSKFRRRPNIGAVIGRNLRVKGNKKPSRFEPIHYLSKANEQKAVTERRTPIADMVRMKTAKLGPLTWEGFDQQHPDAIGEQLGEALQAQINYVMDVRPFNINDALRDIIDGYMKRLEKLERKSWDGFQEAQRLRHLPVRVLKAMGMSSDKIKEITR